MGGFFSSVLDEPHPGFLQRSSVADFDAILDAGGAEIVEELGGVPLGDGDQQSAGGLRIESDFDETFAQGFLDGDFVFQVFAVSFAPAGDVALLSQVWRAA